MSPVNNFIIFIKLLLVFGHLIKSEPHWSYEIISLTHENETPDVIATDLRKIRVSRGVYAISGTYEIKQDLTDDLHMTAFSYYSPTGSSNYIKTPFHIPEINLTELLNTFYKNIVMDELKECTENAVIFENTFRAPVTKRLVTANMCQLSNKNMPSVLRSGYYKLELKFFKQANITHTMIVNVKQE